MTPRETLAAMGVAVETTPLCAPGTLAPDGRVDRMLAVPMKRPTCCTFGGADFGTLYVTGVSHSMSVADHAADPQAGALFAFDLGREWGIRGLLEPRLNLN